MGKSMNVFHSRGEMFARNLIRISRSNCRSTLIKGISTSRASITGITRFCGTQVENEDEVGVGK